jgi:hypothetical protein
MLLWQQMFFILVLMIWGFFQPVHTQLAAAVTVATILLWQRLQRRRLSLAILSLACWLATFACRRLVFADPWCG